MSKQKTSLLEEAKADQKISGRTPLLILAAQQMTSEERKELIKALEDHSISTAALSRALKRRGFNISSSALGQYRRGEIVRVVA